MRMWALEKERGIRITSNKARMVVGDGARLAGAGREGTRCDGGHFVRE